jgi:hypothetical protein
MLWVEAFVLKKMGYNKRNMEQNTTQSYTFPKLNEL